MSAQARIVLAQDNPAFVPFSRIERQKLRLRFAEIDIVVETRPVESVHAQTLIIGFWRGEQAAGRVVTHGQRKRDLAAGELADGKVSISIIGNQETIPAGGIRLGTIRALAIWIKRIQWRGGIGRGGNSRSKCKRESIVQDGIRRPLGCHVVGEDHFPIARICQTTSVASIVRAAVVARTPRILHAQIGHVAFGDAHRTPRLVAGIYDSANAGTIPLARTVAPAPGAIQGIEPAGPEGRRVAVKRVSPTARWIGVSNTRFDARAGDREAKGNPTMEE